MGVAFSYYRKEYLASYIMLKLLLVATFLTVLSTTLGQDDWSPAPCFPMCTTDAAMTSPPADRECVKTDCFDEPLCTNLCGTMGYHYHVWILNNDDNDIFGETWCASDGLGMCYCCEYP